MPDITMCKNKDCKINYMCYRYMAKPSNYQSYAVFKPDDKGKCESYYPMRDARYNGNGGW